MKTLKFLLSAIMAIFLGQTIAAATGLDPAIPISGLLAYQLIPKMVPVGSFLSSPDVSALVAYAGKNQRGLINTLVNGMDIASDIVVMPGIKNKLRIGKLDVSTGTRPFSSIEEFASLSDLNYTDRFLDVFPGKREIQIDVEEYTQTYLSEFLSIGSGAGQTKVSQVPFAAWTWRRVVESIGAELNDMTAYFGFDRSTAVAFAGGATYAAGDYITFTQAGQVRWFKCLATTSAAESPDTTAAKWQNVTAAAITPGIQHYLDAEIAGSNITPVSLGAISSGATALAAFKALYRSMPVVYKNRGIVINASYTDVEFLVDGIEDAAKYVIYNKSGSETIAGVMLPGTFGKCYVKPATWLGSSRRLIAGPSVRIAGELRNSGLLLGTDVLSDQAQINIKEPDLWNLKAGVKFRMGLQIANVDEIRVGDQA
jgi:hypothetical protein